MTRTLAAEAGMIGENIITGPIVNNKPTGYRVQYLANSSGAAFKIFLDQRHRGLPLKDWDESQQTESGGVTYFDLPTANNTVETWKLRYNYRKVVVFRNGLEVTSTSLGHPMPEWLDNITERVGAPGASLGPIGNASGCQ